MISRRRPPRFAITVSRTSRGIPLTSAEVRRVCRIVLEQERASGAEIHVAIVDDAEIHRVNREHLAHDYPTDVISFLYSAEVGEKGSAAAQRKGLSRGAGLVIEGEIVVSFETAAREARSRRLESGRELMLYVVHGLLHLCGYDDLSPPEKRIMRRRERAMMAAIDADRDT
jgi:probable rRNA maturation factor